MFFDEPAKVNLRGASKGSSSSSRQAVLARAQREREDRERRRRQGRASLVLQASWRCALALGRARREARTWFDLTLAQLRVVCAHEAGTADLAAFVPLAAQLTRALLFFSPARCREQDAQRVRVLLTLLLRSYATTDLSTNAAAHACQSAEASP